MTQRTNNKHNNKILA